MWRSIEPTSLLIQVEQEEIPRQLWCDLPIVTHGSIPDMLTILMSIKLLLFNTVKMSQWKTVPPLRDLCGESDV